MHKVFLLLTFGCIHTLSTHAQYCIEDRFTQSAYFSDEQIVVNSDISYGLAEHWFMDQPQPLLNTFDIAYPEKSLDPLIKKPLIVLAHGGGFWGGEKEDFSFPINQLAQSGYVAVSMNYRKGWFGDPENCAGDPLSLSTAIYFAIQDTKACLRYLVEHADEYGIDTTAIFIGGESAGAYAMLNSIYLSQEEWNSVHPGFEELYGDFDHAVNTSEQEYTVKGFLNMWGGVLDTAFCSADEMKPTISFYGTSDDVIPPYDGNVQFCDEYEHVNGSAGLAIHLSNYHIPNVLHGHLLYGHEAYEDTYTTGNIACFVKSVLCNELVTKTVEYEEANCSVMESDVADLQLSDVLVFPNPASEFITIDCRKQFDANPAIRVFDLNGREQAVSCSFNSQILTIRVSELPEGIYQVYVQSNGQTIRAKFLVARV